MTRPPKKKREISPEEKRRVRSYLEREAYGRANVKTRGQVSAATGYHWRLLWLIVRALITDGFPIGPCGDGWFVIANRAEFCEVNLREYSRAMSVLEAYGERQRAFYSYHKIRTEHVDLAQIELPV